MRLGSVTPTTPVAPATYGSVPPGGRLARWRGLPASSRFVTVAVVAGWLVSLAMVEALRQFPFEDSTNNLTRYVMLDRAWFGAPPGRAPPYLAIHPVMGPYLGFDVVGAALVHVFGPVVALRIIAALVVSAIPLGMWLLLDAAGRANRAWALVGVLVGMGFFTVVGFINYTVGLGAALVWLAVWWRWRTSLSPLRIGSLWLGVLGLYLLHLSAPAIVLVVVWVDTFLATAAHAGAITESRPARGAWHRARWHAVVRAWWDQAARERRTWFAVGAALVFAMACLVGGIGAAAPVANVSIVSYPTLLHKLINIFSPFYVFSIGQATIACAVYALIAVAFVRINHDSLARRGHRSAFALSALVFLALYCTFPSGTPGTGYLDMRWLPPVFLLPFAMLESDGRPPPRAIVILMLAGCLAQDAVLWPSFRAIDRELSDFRAVLAQMAPGTQVLELIADRDRHGARIFPYRHLALWHVIERDGRAPGLFNGAGEGKGRPAHTFLRHFVERDHLYEPGTAWGTKDFSPLDWPQIDREYDYIIEAGTDPRATRQIADHARQLAQVGDITLFGVNRARDASATPRGTRDTGRAAWMGSLRNAATSARVPRARRIGYPHRTRVHPRYCRMIPLLSRCVW